MRKIAVVVGAQGGDEGKGKIIDYLSAQYDLVIRYQGGDNAGHTVFNEFGVFHMRLIPSGIFNDTTYCLIGTGTVVNPNELIEEINKLEKRGINTTRLFLSKKAHILMPYHRLIDKANENKNKVIDTTKRGIGPAYADKAFRDNLRFEDLYNLKSIKRYINNTLPKVNNLLQFYKLKPLDENEVLKELKKWEQFFANRLVEPVHFVHNFIEQKKSILFEGQLGLQRDIDLGEYPYVSSSSCTAAYACVSTGIPVFAITDVIGIVRAYPILAGNGPFPTEMDDEMSSYMRGDGTNIDDEYGINTKRPRRIGWFDIPFLKYSCQINGYTELVISKLDRLDTLEKIKICVAYTINNKILNYYPSTSELEKVTPVYITIDGWKQSTKHIKYIDELPKNARKYLQIIEKSVNVPIKLVGVGAYRNDVAQ